MPRVTKADRQALIELQEKLDVLYEAHAEAMIEFGERLEELWEEVAKPSLDAYVSARKEMSGQLEDWAATFRDAVDDLPLRLQESGDDNGWSDMANFFSSAAEDYAITLSDRIEAPDAPEPHDHCEALDGLLMDLGSE